MVLPEIKQILTSKQVKQFGIAVTIITIVGVAAYMVRGFFEIRTLQQQYHINKYTLKSLSNQENQPK